MNLVKAQRQAALIANGEFSMGSPTADDEMEQTLKQIDQTPLKQLAGMKESKTKI